MGSPDFVTGDKFGKKGLAFFWPFVLEIGSFWLFSALDMARWQKVRSGNPVDTIFGMWLGQRSY